MPLMPKSTPSRPSLSHRDTDPPRKLKKAKALALWLMRSGHQPLHVIVAPSERCAGRFHPMVPAQPSTRNRLPKHVNKSDHVRQTVMSVELCCPAQVQHRLCYHLGEQFQMYRDCINSRPPTNARGAPQPRGHAVRSTSPTSPPRFPCH